jgi:serine/threonine-protein kinase
MGTVHYMSPEQARGRVDEIDARSDQFSFAVIVYEMLTGQDAFRGDDVSSLVYQIVHEEPPALSSPDSPIPPDVASVLKRALAKDKERRFPTVKAFATALGEAAAAGADATRTTIATKPEGAGGSPRSRRIAGAAALALLAFVVAGTLYARRGPPRTADAPPPATPPPIAEHRAEPPLAPIPTPAPPPVAVPAPELPATKKHTVVRAVHRIEPVPAVAAPAGGSVNCSPNYYLDAQGDKHFKKECFLNPTASQ